MPDNTPNAPATSPPLADWFTPWRFAALLALAIFAAFPEIALGSMSWFKFDYGVLGYPFVQYQRDCFWRGELPLWNPLSNCGAPFLAQWGTMSLYPLSLIYLLLPLPWSLGLFCLAHLFLGGLGMYFLAHRWTRHRLAAAAAGIIFAFNGATLSCLIWPNYLAALAWMPWLVLAAERAWRDGGRWIIAAGLVATLQMLSGSPEIILFTWFILVLMVAGDLCLKRGSPTVLLRRFAVVLLIVTGLSAMQLLPFFDLLAHSQRDRDFATAKWAMPGWGWANLLVPLFHYFMTPQGTYFQTGQEFLSSYYPGIGVLALGSLAVWRVRERRVFLLTAITTFCLVMALGDNGFVYSVFREWIPVVGIARYPIKFVLLTVLTLPLLAAFGVRWCQTNDSPQKSLLTVGGVLAALTVLLVGLANQNRFTYDQWPVTGYNTAWRLVFLTALVGLLWLLLKETRWPHSLVLSLGLLLVPALDGLTHLPQHNPVVPFKVYETSLAREKFAFNPQPAPGQSRIFITPFAEDQLLRSSIPDMTNDFLVKHFALWSNLNAVEGVPKVNGSSTLQIREQAQVQKLLYASTNTYLPHLLDFLAVSYSTPQFQVFPWTNRATQLPWVTAGQKPIFADTNITLTALTNDTFDPRAEVYLPEDAKGAITETASRAAIADLKIKSNRKEFTVNAEAPAMVVIAETFYHPWKALVDEQPVTLWHANHAFQALQVGAGQHRVRLIYEDGNFKKGLLISALTLVGCVIGWFWGRRV